MFRWSKGIYMDDKVRENPKKYRRRVERRKPVPGAYCVTLPANASNCMDIYYSGAFWFQHYRKQNIEIIGLAASREGVEQILVQMTTDIIKEYGRMNAEVVRRYFAMTV